jgi:hypothetical protein
LANIVTAPSCASALPGEIAALVFSVMLVAATMFPAKGEGDKSNGKNSSHRKRRILQQPSTFS